MYNNVKLKVDLKNHSLRQTGLVQDCFVVDYYCDHTVISFWTGWDKGGWIRCLVVKKRQGLKVSKIIIIETIFYFIVEIHLDDCMKSRITERKTKDIKTIFRVEVTLRKTFVEDKEATRDIQKTLNRNIRTIIENIWQEKRIIGMKVWDVRRIGYVGLIEVQGQSIYTENYWLKKQGFGITSINLIFVYKIDQLYWGIGVWKKKVDQAKNIIGLGGPFFYNVIYKVFRVTERINHKVNSDKENWIKKSLLTDKIWETEKTIIFQNTLEVIKVWNIQDVETMKIH